MDELKTLIMEELHNPDAAQMANSSRSIATFVVHNNSSHH
jgi:hypothetical protein